jgi:hypothetical protein
LDCYDTNMSREDPTLEELRLLWALANVCDEFIPGSWTHIDPGGLGAGETGVMLLAEYGLATFEGSAGGSWTTKAIVVRENDDINPDNFERIKAAYLADPGRPLWSIPQSP